MLKRGSQKGVEIPYLINEVYINEHNNGYYYDVSTTNDLRKIVTDKKIRVTFDHWNLYRPSTCKYVTISELKATCIYRKIIYECRSLINVCASVTLYCSILCYINSLLYISKICCSISYLSMRVVLCCVVLY